MIFTTNKPYAYLAVLLAACCALIAGCSADKSAGGARVIEFMNWESTPEGTRFINSLIREFEKENPGVRVKSVVVPGTSYNTVLLTRFSSNTAPDVFELNTEAINPFLEKKLLLNLQPYINKSSKLREEEFFPLGLVNFRYDGKHYRRGDIYGFPKDLVTAALAYNKTLFDAAGQSYPNDKWTIQDYVNAAKKLTEIDSSGRYIRVGIERPLNPLDMTLNMNGRIWSPDYKKCLLNSKAGVDAFQFVYDLQEVHKVALRSSEIKDGLAEGFGFKSGKTAMSLVYRYELPDMVSSIGGRFEWRVAPLPLVNGKRIQVFRGPSGWCISSQTRHPEEAFKFMEFLAGKKGQLETAKLGYMPADKEVAYSVTYMNNLKRPDSAAVNKVFLKAMDDLYPGFVNPYIPTKQLQLIIEDGCDPGAGRRNGGSMARPVAEMADTINKLINEAIK